MRLYLYERDFGQCQYCAVEVDWAAAKYDHVVPFHFGGTTTPENMVVACSTCNRLKGNAQIPEHLRPDTSGDYEAWLKKWDGRNPFRAGGAELRFGIFDDPDPYDSDREQEYRMRLLDDLAPYRPETDPY